MASKRPSVLKREREKKQADRAAQKREERARREAARGGDTTDSGGAPVATYDDLEGYGIARPMLDNEERNGR
jgi:hypothetical protein